MISDSMKTPVFPPLLAAVLGGAMPLAILSSSVLAADGPVAPKVEPAVSLKARPFALQQVRLLDGPFKAAMERDARYLLELDPDRLLHNFRVNAGLPSNASPLGGWEAPKVELHGHAVGHYLSGCALMYASTGDERLNERAALLVRELAKCQAALGAGGYLSAFPESFFDRLESDGKVWAPYYTLHKVLAGLIDVHVHCGNAQALAVAEKFGDWVKTRNDRLSDEQLQKMLLVEHGGINESMANLYALTGNPRHLEAARRLFHQRVLDPLAQRQDHLAGLHANTQFPKVIGTARLYELTGEERYRTITEFFWDRVVHHHTYVNGGNSDHEHFGPPDQLHARVSPFTAESCNTYNMLKLTRQVFSWEAAADQADYYERALYNHILPSQDPRTGMMAYHVPLYGGWFMPYNTTNDSFWCCTGSGFENHAKYGDSIYWRDGDGLFVNLYIASELQWREQGLTVRQQTRYPEQDTVRLEMNCAQPVTLNLRLRYPGWAKHGMDIRLNGEPFQHGGSPGSYVAIRRAWKSGDRVEVKLPMALRLEPMPDNATRAAICYGPIVLAGELGREGMRAPMPYAKSQGDFFKTTPPRQPVLLAGRRALTDWVEPVVDRPLAFRTKGVGQPGDISLVAFYLLPPQRYSLYWDLLTPEQWKDRQALDAVHERRAQALQARTLEAVRLGDFESERKYNLQEERSRTGTFSSRTWRDAADGGWFSFDFKVAPDKPVKLLCTFWGSDGGSRTFDILANGKLLATQRLSRDHPGEFFDVEYPISRETLGGQSRLTVKFQAHPGNMAGGVFDVRVVKASEQ